MNFSLYFLLLVQLQLVWADHDENKMWPAQVLSPEEIKSKNIREPDTKETCVRYYGCKFIAVDFVSI